MQTEAEVREHMQREMNRLTSKFNADLKAKLAEVGSTVELAGKARLRELTKIERDRADQMEKLLAATKMAVDTSNARENGFIAAVAKLREDMAAAVTGINAQFAEAQGMATKLQEMLEKVGLMTSNLGVKSTEMVSAFDSKVDQLVSLIDETKVIHAGLGRLRDEINGRIGVLNNKLMAHKMEPVANGQNGTP